MSNLLRPQVAAVQKNIEQVIKGKGPVVKLALIGVLAKGHILLEDVPGVGKTTLAQLISRSLNLTYSRIQFTSDLLPSDLLGVSIFHPDTREFEFKPGPLFANVVLADEINRTTPKTQSALLEAMNSAQVTVDKQTHDLPRPFLVLATQNPVEFHGTFPLPKSQMDRFLLRLRMGYPTLDDEVTVLREQGAQVRLAAIEPVLSPDDLLNMQEEVEQVRIDDILLDYIARIAAESRESRRLELGVSTRGAIALKRAAQAHAYVEGRDYTIPDDIKTMGSAVLSHRVQALKAFQRNGSGLSEEEEAIADILQSVAVPV